MTAFCLILGVISTSIVWERTYPGCVFIDVHETSDHGFIIAGKHYVVDNHNLEQIEVRGYKAYLYRFSDIGDLLWSTQVIGKDHNCSGLTEWVEELPDGGYIATGYFNGSTASDAYKNFFLARLSSNGDIIWISQGESKEDERGYAVSPMPGGGFAVVGACNQAPGDGTFMFMLFDEDGSQLCRTEWGQAACEGSSSTGYIVSTENDRILLSGSGYNGSWPPYPIQACLSPVGELLWCRYYHDYGLWGRESYMGQDGYCLFCTNRYALKVDTTSGDVLDQYQFEYNMFFESINSLDMTHDGGLIAAGYCDYNGPPQKSDLLNSQPFDGWIVRLSDELQLMWREHLDDASHDQVFNSVRQLSTGGYIAAGEYSSKGGWLVRFEPEVGIGSISPSEGLEVSMGSNPVSLPAIIEIDLSLPARVELDLYDISGRLMGSVDSFLETGFHRFEFDDLQHGMHLLFVRSGNRRTILRFMVL